MAKAAAAQAQASSPSRHVRHNPVMGDELPLIGCALSEQELAERGARAAGLRKHVLRVQRADERVGITFTADVDEPLLHELIEAERQCCAFFEFDWDESAHRLEIAIPEARFKPTLDALTDGIAGAGV